MPESILLYIHGFNSSPKSVKASQMRRHIELHHPEITLCAPQLPNHPQAAAECLLEQIAAHPGKHFGVVGSSLGGYLTSWLLENHLPRARGVLINPAVKPYELLQDYLGEQVNPYTEQRYTLGEEHIAQLHQLDTPLVQGTERHWVLLQQGDETLDASQAEKKYAQCKLTVEPGGDHSFVGFERYLGDIVDYLFCSES